MKIIKLTVNVVCVCYVIYVRIQKKKLNKYTNNWININTSDLKFRSKIFDGVAHFALSQTLTDPHMERMMEPAPQWHRGGPLRRHVSSSLCLQVQSSLSAHESTQSLALFASFCYLPSIRDSTCVGKCCKTNSSKSHLKLLDDHADMFLLRGLPL